MLTSKEKKKRKTELNRAYRTSDKGKAKINAYNRKRYRSARDCEAANTVENMLNHARVKAF